MIVFTEADKPMLAHVMDVVTDRVSAEKPDYDPQDFETIRKLGQMADPNTKTLLVISGRDAETDEEALDLFRQVVQAELDNWVPDASQRLIYRAAKILGIYQPNPGQARSDCGVHPKNHALFMDWIAGLSVYRCSTCFRVYPA